MHIGGQEVAMHDPKVMSPDYRGVRGTLQNGCHPGRHTTLFAHTVYQYPFPQRDRLCHFGRWPENEELMVGIFKSVTGW